MDTVAAVDHQPAVPITIDATAQTIGVLQTSGHQATVNQLSALAADPSVHQLASAPFAPVDASSLVNAGLDSELAMQVARGTALVSHEVTHLPVAPDRQGVWVSERGLDPATLAQLQSDGYSKVIVPSGSVSSAPTDGSTAQPFSLSTSTGRPMAAFASSLSARFAGPAGNPVLAAHQLVAELAQIYYEQPNDDTARAIVAVPPTTWPDDPAFVGALLGALHGNPIIQSVTASNLFATFTDTAGCRGPCRSLSGGGTGGLPAAAIRTQRQRVTSFATAAPTAHNLIVPLGDLVLAGESDLLRPGQQAAVLDNTGSAIDAQLKQLVVAGGQSITLTSQQGRLPIDIVSSAPYPVTATLTVTSDKLLFANGTTGWTQPTTVLPGHSHTDVVYVNVRARTSGVFTVAITLHSPSGGLQLSSGQIVVRSTATSIVGIILSLGAIAVLAVWWVRTSRQAADPAWGRGDGRARGAGGGPVTDTEIDGLPAAPGGGRRRLAGATAGMAVGTTLSRLTGLASVVALTVALGGGGFADGYNLANTTPNIITDIVIGGVLSATFVPVFVDRLTTRRADEAWEAISAVVTVTVVVLLAATVAFFFLAPDIVHLYTVTNHNLDVDAQRREAVFFLRWFVPQLTCYGLIALFTALLNTRGKFAAPMFVPIANNLVLIVVLLWFHALVPHPSLASIDEHHTDLVLLAVGTTLGVVVQAALLLPSLARARLHVHFLWRPAHEAMRRITRLAGWTFGWVVANQVALVVILALADGVKVPGAVSAYTYAYRFFQLPYGIVAVSVMSAVTPSLAARWARGDMVAFRHRMAFGLRGILAIIIPAAVGMVLLSHTLIALVLAHGAETTAEASSAATALAMFSLGLPGFCTFLYMVRILQAMQDTRTAFRLYLVENGLNIVFGVALVGPLGVRGLALSLSIAYSAAAVLAMAVIRRRVGGLGGDDLTVPVKRVLAASAVMAVATVLALNVSGAPSGFGLLGRVVLAVVVGVVAYVAAAAVLAERDARRSAAAVAMRDPSGRPGPVGPDDESEPDTNGDDDPNGPAEDQSVEPFHGRLDDQPAGGPYGRLRPVNDLPEDEAPTVDEEEPMARIRVVTDSACDLSAKLAAERNLTIVPLTIRFGSDEFIDGATLTTDEFWSRCAASDVLPETAAPSPVPSRRHSWPPPPTGTTGCSASICPVRCRPPTRPRWPRPRPSAIRSPSAPSTRDR